MEESFRREGDVASGRVGWAALLGLLVGAGFVWLAFRKLELGEIVAALRAADPWPWVPLAVLFYLAGHVVRGLRCRWLVSHDANLPLPTATNVVVLGYAVNNVLPARLGEVARAGLLGERIGMPFVQSLTVTLLERILDGWTMLLLFAAGLALAPVGGAMLQSALVAAAIFGVVSLGIVAMLTAPYRLASFVSHLAGRVRPAWQERAWRFCISVANGLGYLRRPADAARVGLLSVVVWLLESGMFLMMLPAFGLPLRVEWAVLAMAVTNLGILIPSTPGYVGPFHYFCMQTLVLLGVAGVTATSYAIAVHAVFYVPITIWGVGVVLRYGIELGWIRAMARDAERDAAATEVDGVPMVVLGSRRVSPRSDEPGQLILALTAALVPAPESDEQAAAAVRTAGFVQGQVNALPMLLWLALELGLVGFRVLVRLRYLRSYCALPAETQRRVAAWWAYGPHRLTRTMFRVLRSTAMLAYYEDVEAHP
ncbi:MAG: lysylphosphatidylglycerol synthase transmembrane domain-containing protein [Myxococcota bacterium]